MKPEISHHHYHDGTHRFDYTLQRKARIKHRYIRIRDGQAHVTAPRHTPLKTLHVFVADHAEWIARQIQKSSEHTNDLTRSDATVLWHGKTYSVTIASGKSVKLKFENGIAHFTLPKPHNHERLQQLLWHHYKIHASDYILPRLETWAKTMNLYPVRVTFRRARTRWGSCSSLNTLSLNTHLMMLPDELIDYIIVHELAHIRYKNHGKDFWALVARYVPQYQKKRKQLRAYEAHLR